MVTEDTTPVPGARILGEVSLEPSGDSTTVTVTCSRGMGPWLSRTVNDLVGQRLLGPRLRKGLTALRQQIKAEIADGTLQIPERNERVAAEEGRASGGSSAASDDDPGRDG